MVRNNFTKLVNNFPDLENHFRFSGGYMNKGYRVVHEKTTAAGGFSSCQNTMDMGDMQVNFVVFFQLLLYQSLTKVPT